jgi:hypothetical protein
MPTPPEPETQGNLSIGNDLTVEHGLTVTEGFSEGNKLSLPGFNGPFPPKDLLWGSPQLLLWGGNILQW